MEGYLVHRDPGQLYLPVLPPHLNLWDLGAYGGLSGPLGSRAAVPASHSSSTPYLGSGGLWRAIWATGIQGGCTCQLFLPTSYWSWPILEGHLGHGDPVRVTLRQGHSYTEIL